MKYPYITNITEVIIENKNVKTIKFEHGDEIIPGQFYMVWIPGVDEVPMSVSYIDKKIKGFTFKRVGDATNALFKLKHNDKIGIKGPLGNGFIVEGDNILFVGGGTGIAMLAPAIEKAIKNKINVSVVLGIKTKNDLFFEKRIKKTGAKTIITTDDGSYGIKGLATDIAEKLLKQNNYDSILTCGPEIMMKKLLNMCKNKPFQASIERYMKCGFGLCGQCCIGEGLRVCIEGPVFNGKILKKVNDFGVFKRDSAGKKIKI
jgi:dihydroorotate dehydrogenase electron transfer subunit